MLHAPSDLQPDWLCQRPKCWALDSEAKPEVGSKDPECCVQTASSSFFPPPHPQRHVSTHQRISPGRVWSENRNQSRYFQQGEFNMRFNCTNGETREATQGERQHHNPQQEAPPSGWEDIGEECDRSPGTHWSELGPPLQDRDPGGRR